MNTQLELTSSQYSQIIQAVPMLFVLYSFVSIILLISILIVLFEIRNTLQDGKLHTGNQEKVQTQGADD